MAQHGDFVWHELMTPEPDRMAAFYGRLFRWKAREESIGEMKYWVFTTEAGTDVAGMMMPPPMAPRATVWSAYVAVEDVDAASTAAIEGGGAVIVPPFDLPGVGRLCVLSDSLGGMFNVMTSARA